MLILSLSLSLSLIPDDQPKSVLLKDYQLTITKLDLMIDLIILNHREQFLQAPNQFILNSRRSGLLFIVGGFSFCVLYV